MVLANSTACLPACQPSNRFVVIRYVYFTKAYLYYDCDACACLSSLRIDFSIYRFLNSIHKDKHTHTVEPPFNDSCRVREWDSAHSFANIDADERQSSQMQINTLLTITHTHANERARSRTKWIVSCCLCSSSLSLGVASFIIHSRATDAHLLLSTYTNMEHGKSAHIEMCLSPF